jgi:glycosyltransferase involved in cell wall biosynthesis
MTEFRKPRLLIFIVAYNAERTISAVLRRIPAGLSERYEVELLVIDDASRDTTFAQSHDASNTGVCPFPVHVLANPVNQGYGGNQKLGYQYAIENDYDFVALLHGDGQYAPECLPALLEPLRKGAAAAVFGSRMLTPGGARKGGMPAYKFLGNKILTWTQNKLLRSALSEFHSGYRIYSVQALQAIPFERNSNDFHFDTEIIIQLLIARKVIVELPIPTYYGDEICNVNGLQYAWNVIAATLKARLQEFSLLYDRRFDCAPAGSTPRYTLKLGYPSSHTLALDSVRPGAKVLDMGCAGGHLGAVLKRTKNCRVSAVDVTPAREQDLDEFQIHDMNRGMPDIPVEPFDIVLLLDVIEHLNRPEMFLEQLRDALAFNRSSEVLISTGNVAYFFTRLMLLLGQFNYGKRGILDLTHTRLFTFSSLRRAIEQAGFAILDTKGIPAPFPLAVGDNLLSQILLGINRLLILLCRSLFSYQIFVRVKPLPTVTSLLRATREHSRRQTALLIEASRANADAAFQPACKPAGTGHGLVG